MIKRNHFLVSGQVQGVGFRRFALKKAIEFHILGWVRNLVDGRVEGIAQGQDHDLQLFTDEIRKGPNPRCVENLKVTDMGPPGRYGTFEVWPDSEETWNE